VGRRVDVFVDQLSSIWLPALVLTAGPVVLLVTRRGALLARGLWGMPFTRAGLLAMGTAAVIAMITVPGGLATAGVAGPLLSLGVLVLLFGKG